jgi:hypothetical protein
VIYAAVALGVACCLFFHGYEIFNFTLSIDEELNLGGESALGYLQHGRWGLALRTLLLMPDTTAPIAAIATGLALYGAAFVLLIRQYRIQHWGAVAVAAPLYFGFPVLLYAIAFSNIALSLGISAAATVLALAAAEEIRPLRVVLAALLVAFAVSIYQSFLFFAIVIFAADLISRLWPAERPPGKEARRRLLWYAAIIAGGTALYALIAFLSLQWFGLHLDYVTQFVKPESFTRQGPSMLRATLVEMVDLYSGAAPTFLHYNFYYRLLVVVCAVLLLWKLTETARTSPRLALLLAVLLLAILAAPFLQHPLNRGHLPYRTLLGLPAAVAVLALFATEIAPPRWRTWLLVPLAVLVAIQFSWINNRQYYAAHWSLERDKATATEMLSRIGQILPRQDKYTIAVVGSLARKRGALIPRVPDSTLGASFFQWDAGNASRVAAFLNVLSDAKFSAASLDQSQAAFDAAATMPSWAEPGSIAQVGDVVVIKLSNANKSQLAPLCRNSDTGACAGYEQ